MQLKNLFSPFKSLFNIYKVLSVWGKLLLLITVILIIIVAYKRDKGNKRHEGFENSQTFAFDTGEGIYDDFYVSIYDYLFFNTLSDDYQVGEIINSTYPNDSSVILDVGCRTGRIVNEFGNKKYNIFGIDHSAQMINKAEELYPQYKFFLADTLKTTMFYPNSFTHILCLHYTIYYVKDKNLFFSNCFRWLRPNCYLIINLVDRENFNPVFSKNKNQVSKRKHLKFDNFDYESNFILDKDNDMATFLEKIKLKNSHKVKRNKHIMYIPNDITILQIAKDEGFLIDKKIDLMNSGYNNNYLYVLKKA